MCACVLSCFSHGRIFATLWTSARQAPQSIGFFRQDYQSGLPCLPSGIFLTQGSNSCLLCLLLCRSACVCVCVCVCVQMSAVVPYWLEMDICSEGRLLRCDGGYILPDSGGGLILVSNSLVSHLLSFLKSFSVLRENNIKPQVT